jgi:DNA-binding SARP family transcriptional activator
MQDGVGIHVLGPVEVTGPQGSVSLRGAGQRTLIARLGLPPGITVSREALIHALWTEAAPPTATKTLTSYLAHLRHQLREGGLVGLIATRGPGYVLLAHGDAVVAARFDLLAGQGRVALAAGVA